MDGERLDAGGSRVQALAGRYLDSVMRALVDDHYLENELRLAHLAECATTGREVDLPRLRDPQRHDVEAYVRLREERRRGRSGGAGGRSASYAYAPEGRMALDDLCACLDRVRADGVAGDLVTYGEGRGGIGILLRAYLEAHGEGDRRVWVAGRFRGAADGRSAPHPDDGLAGLRPDLNLVRDGFDRFGLLDERVRFLQGDPAAALSDPALGAIALLHLGDGLGADAATVLDQLSGRLAAGAVVVVDDVSPEVEGVLVAHRRRQGLVEPVERTSGASVWWRVGATVAGGQEPPRPHGLSRAPLVSPVGAGGRDLSVVVVVHDMGREAPRTLHSLSRSYQRDVDDLDYEVIVVENGSPPGAGLGDELVRRAGPEFRHLDLGAEATPSPAPAVNRGLADASGRAIAVMIDGAHLLTPGVLHHAMTGLSAYAPAVVAVQPWYLGPGQQGEAMRAGYDQAAEDQLLDRVEWPEDGYRLFEISHFQGERDWLDGLWESNCLFAPRALLEQVGGMDEGFDHAGGGFANLDLYERLGASPGVRIVSPLGEGSFHQTHGGTTTNQADPSERRRRVVAYGERYAELRGRPFSGPQKALHYVGSFHGEASLRTRARRMTGAAFAVDEAIEPDGRAPWRSPIPDEVRDGFVAAYWRSGAWCDTTWMGRRAANAPTDLFAYQDILAEVRPDWVIETGTGEGGRALFLASVCDLLGHGRVVSIDERPGGDPPAHPRLVHLAGRAFDDEVVGRVRELVGPDGRAVVVLGTRGARHRTRREFDAYAPFVPVGSYVIIEHTVLNGHPVDPAHGSGPFEAARRILNQRGDFMADSRREAQGLSFNPGGYLRRVR